MIKCIKCDKELSQNEMALHRKLVNRGATEFMCKSCLAKHFEITEAQCDEMIKQFKESGCTLFV